MSSYLNAIGAAASYVGDVTTSVASAAYKKVQADDKVRTIANGTFVAVCTAATISDKVSTGVYDLATSLPATAILQYASPAITMAQPLFTLYALKGRVSQVKWVLSGAATAGGAVINIAGKALPYVAPTTGTTIILVTTGVGVYQVYRYVQNEAPSKIKKEAFRG